MRRGLRLLAAVVLGGGVLGAQEPRLVRATPELHEVPQRASGVVVTPVADAPFSATIEVVSHRRSADGREQVMMTHNAIARSTSGKIYNERRRMVPTDFKGEPPLMSARIYDPVSRLSISLLPQMRLAREMTLRAPAHSPAETQAREERKLLPGETEQSLGTKQMDGLELRGTLRERTVSGAVSGTGKPVVVSDEMWFSPELSMNVLVRHQDARMGERLMVMTKVHRSEPPVERFAVPADYKVVDETTAESPEATQSGFFQ